jgi:hypothetical protein
MIKLRRNFRAIDEAFQVEIRRIDADAEADRLRVQAIKEPLAPVAAKPA